MRPARIHDTACIDPGAVVGHDTFIWHFVHVMAGARIGAECVIGQGCFVASGAVIEDGCRLQNHVSVYEGVELGSGVFVGPSAVFTNVRRPRARFPRKSEFEPTRVGDGATIGANATIVCGVKIGARAFVGAGAVVTRDVPDYAVVLGAPARVVGWTCACGDLIVRTARRPAGRTCARCGAGPGRVATDDRRPCG